MTMDKALFRDVKRRQKQILKSLGSDILIIPTGGPPGGTCGSLRDTDFYYLTGFPETGAILVMDPTQSKEMVTLFVKEKNRQEEVWQGFTIGVRAAGENYPVDKVYGAARFESVLKSRLKGRTVYFKSMPNHKQCKLIDKLLEQQGCTVESSGGAFERIGELRIIKSTYELKQLREAIRITGEAHHACMRAGRKYKHEYQFEAEYEYCCKMQGVRLFGFSTIVAAGAHGTCQHYVENNGPVGKNDLVLIDAGAAWNRYTADLTRTFPASGSFNPIQHDLYDVVLASQNAGVAAVKPGVRFHELHNLAAKVLIDGLKDLGILHGSTDEIIEKNAYKDFWPGGLGHSIGLDVHDVTPAAYRGPDAKKKLTPGMVITIEPGFYSQDFNHMIPNKIKHIGIRIEDDVLVTKDGHENLSIDCVKEIDDVEDMVKSGK